MGLTLFLLQWSINNAARFVEIVWYPASYCRNGFCGLLILTVLSSEYTALFAFFSADGCRIRFVKEGCSK